jgi:hypothetical protein
MPGCAAVTDKPHSQGMKGGLLSVQQPEEPYDSCRMGEVLASYGGGGEEQLEGTLMTSGHTSIAKESPWPQPSSEVAAVSCPVCGQREKGLGGHTCAVL